MYNVKGHGNALTDTNSGFMLYFHANPTQIATTTKSAQSVEGVAMLSLCSDNYERPPWVNESHEHAP